MAPGVPASIVNKPRTLLAVTPVPARQAMLPRTAASAASASSAVREAEAPLTVSVTCSATAWGLELGDAPEASAAGELVGEPEKADMSVKEAVADTDPVAAAVTVALDDRDADAL